MKLGVITAKDSTRFVASLPFPPVLASSVPQSIMSIRPIRGLPCLALLCALALVACGAADDQPDADGGTECAPCIDPELRWGQDGGFVAYTDASELRSCNTYRHTREPAGDPEQTSLACERSVPCTGSGLHGVSDVLRALSDPDVQQAVAEHGVVYGVDSRPVDGTVFRIQVGSSAIDVGLPCPASGGGGCDPIPTGVSALADLLHALSPDDGDGTMPLEDS